jgi:hypothetical protein
LCCDFQGLSNGDTLNEGVLTGGKYLLPEVKHGRRYSKSINDIFPSGVPSHYPDGTPTSKYKPGLQITCIHSPVRIN